MSWGYENGYGEYFDALAFHPFPQSFPTSAACDRPWENLFGPLDEQRPCGGIAAMRSVMVRNGDGDKKIWATEWGSSFPPANDPSLPEKAARFTDTVRLWREQPWAGPLFLFTVVDPEWCPPGPCWGVVTRDKAPKQPQYSMLSLALRFIRPECGEVVTQPALAPSDVLEPGQCWRSTWTGDRLISKNGHVRLRFTAEGQLILTVGDAVIWSAGEVRGAILRNQVDGNLVLFDLAGNPVWSSGSGGNRPSNLLVTDDGNLIMRTLEGQQTWSSGTPRNGQLFRTSQDKIAVSAGGALIWFDSFEQAADLEYKLDSVLTVPDAWASGRPTMPSNGTLIRSPSDGIGVMAGGGVLWFSSLEELNASYPGKANVGVPESWLDTLKFPADGTLVRAAGDPQTWRLSGGRRTAVTAAESDPVTIVGAKGLSLIPAA